MASINDINLCETDVNFKPQIKMFENDMELTFTDPIDLQKCKYLFQLPYEELGANFDRKRYSEEECFKHYNDMKQFLVEVISRNQDRVLRTYKLNPCNRMYAVGYPKCVSYCESNIRNFILNKNVKDYDMINCNPTILLYLYKKHNLPYEKMQEYCNNRKELLEVANLNKMDVHKLMNQDRPIYKENEFIDDLIHEVNGNKLDIINLESDKIQYIYDKNVNDKFKKSLKHNPLSSKQCAVLYYYENKALLKVVQHSHIRNQVRVLMYDGFNAEGECDIKLMNKLTAKYGLKWAEKPVESRFKMGIVDEDKCFADMRKYKKKDFKLIFKEDFNKSSFELAKKIAPVLRGEFIYGKKWYVLGNNKLWRDITEMNVSMLPYISEFLLTGIDAGMKWIKEEYTKAQASEDEDKIKRFEEMKKGQMKCNKMLDGTLVDKLLKNLQPDYHLGDVDLSDKLDKNPWCFVYRNGVYDVRTKEFKWGISPLDYVTKTLQFDYNPKKPNKEDIKWWEDQMFKMFCDKKKTEYYWYILASCLVGVPDLREKFYFFVGAGGNMKTTILEYLTEIMPEYVCKGSSEVIEASCGTKHKFMTKYGSYRIVFLEEMKDGSPLDVQLIKLLSEGKKVENQVLFQQNPQVMKILAKSICLSNYRPNFKDVDGGLRRRFEMAHFTSRFTETATKDDYKKGVFKAVPAYIFKQEMLKRRDAFMHILLSYCHKYYENKDNNNGNGMPDCPQDWKDDAELTLSDNDKFADWAKETFEECDDKDECIGITQIQEEYKMFSQENTLIKKTTIMNKMKNNPYKYDPQKQINKKKGAFRGIRRITQTSTYVKDDSDSEDECNVPKLSVSEEYENYIKKTEEQEYERDNVPLLTTTEEYERNMVPMFDSDGD